MTASLIVAALLAANGVLVASFLLGFSSLLLLLHFVDQPGVLQCIAALCLGLSPILVGVVSALLVVLGLRYSENGTADAAEGAYHFEDTSLVMVGALCAGAWLLASPYFLDSYVDAIASLASGSLVNLSGVVVSVVGRVLFCSAVLALCFLLSTSLSEFVGRFLLRASGVSFQIPWFSFRIGVLAAILGIGTQLIAGLFVAELSPLRILHGLH